MILESVLPLSIELGILAGLAVAGSGYIQEYSKKHKDGSHEKFNVDKFAMTVAIGAVVGGAMAFISDFDSAVTLFLVNAGIIAIIGSLVKAFFRMS